MGWEEIVMSRIGLLTALLVASSAFGFDMEARHGHGKGHHHGKGRNAVSLDGDYTGGGWWKSSDGTKGKFELTTNLKKEKDGMTVKESVVIHMPDKTEKKMEDEITIKNGKDGFFEVHKKGTKIGTGYCGIKQCHYEGEEGGDAFEETVTFHGGKIYKLGSHAMKDVTIAYQGSLTKKAAKKGGKCGGGCDCDKGGKKADCKDCDACEAE
jgi:hypothetical protein